MEIHGTYADAFQPVRDRFEQNFLDGLEDGACVAVTVDGAPVVDLWAGEAGPDGAPWQRDTIANVWSSTKTMAAVCMLMLADRGLLDFDAPVADYWPEFAENGKEGVLVRHVMSHSAGLSGFDPPTRLEHLYDRRGVAASLARQAPWWEPGTASGYHAITQGQLQGEILERITGVSLGTFFRGEVAEPLGADFHIGLDAAHDGRVAELIPPAPDPAMEELDPNSIAARTMASCPLDATVTRTRAWRAAEIPAAGGTGNARSIARVHSALACGGSVDGVRLMSPETVERVREVQTDGVDLVLGKHVTFGLGFATYIEDAVAPPNPRHFRWGGWGGSMVVVDLDARVSIAYVMNRMMSGALGDTRGGDLLSAVYESIG